ncbi:MAG: hypothetical protein LBG21_03170 [Campylobacteraceae bacterium]|nr:hypothetical protein [Campylobacteraceae bacterium]
MSPSVIPATERQAYEVSAYREGMRESMKTVKDGLPRFARNDISSFSTQTKPKKSKT